MKVNEIIYVYFHKIYDLLIRPSVYLYVEKVNVFDMLPVITVPFVFHGLYIHLYKKNQKLNLIFYTIIFTSMFWIYYAFNNTIIVMDKVRFVTITSWLLTIPFAVSLDYIYGRIPDNFKLNLKPLYLHVIMIIFLIFNIKTYVYTNNDLDIGFINFENTFIKNGNPTNNHVKKEDLRIFNENVKTGSIFLASPWKSLVISTLTDNIPLDSKSSYLSVNKYSYNKFVELSCDQKNIISDSFKLNYFYGPQFNCDRFGLIDYDYDNKMFLYEFK